jgi:hypothetical protein
MCKIFVEQIEQEILATGQNYDSFVTPSQVFLLSLFSHLVRRR